MKVTVSAPGKLMLFGEHAVVYGYPCLVTAVDRRLSVSVERISSNEDSIITPQVKDTTFVEKTLDLFRRTFKPNDHVRIETVSQFSHNLGFGSSSAVTIALLKALSEAYDIKQTPQDIFNMAYQIVLDVQGTGSGFDLAAAAYGGTLEFVKGGKVIEPLNLHNLPLIVAYSGIKADTPSIVKELAKRYQNNPDKTDMIFKQIADLTNQAKQMLSKQDFHNTGLLMNENHRQLQHLGVSTEKLDRMVEAAVVAGAYGAKLSGAGGGDCIICLAPAEKKNQVEQSITQAGGEIISVTTNTRGMRVETQ
jgi:mevalonate kinase